MVPSPAPFDKSLQDPLVDFGFEQLTVAGSSVGFTAATFGGAGIGRPALSATFLVETAPIRFTLDGATTPTSAVGQLANVGDIYIVWGSLNIQNFRAIRTTGTSALLDVTYAR